MATNSTPYVQDVKKWVKFYEDQVKNRHKSHDGRHIYNSSGGGIYRPYKTKYHFVVPIERPSSESHTSDKPVKVDLVSPAPSTVQQAKTDLENLLKPLRIKRK